MPDQQGELRLGVIGTGCIGMEHIRNALLLPSVRVVAIADPHEPSRQTALAELQHAGVREVIALERDAEMLQLSDVDAVLVCTPNDTHHAVMRQVLASGKHCLVEKPLCTLISHCAETVALARQPGGFGGTAPLLWCGMEYRCASPESHTQLLAQSDSLPAGTLSFVGRHRLDDTPSAAVRVALAAPPRHRAALQSTDTPNGMSTTRPQVHPGDRAADPRGGASSATCRRLYVSCMARSLCVGGPGPDRRPPHAVDPRAPFPLPKEG